MQNYSRDELSPTQLQEQIVFLKDQLREAQKMTALGELVSTTTHEFNNVLMTIINYAKIGMRNPDTATRDKAFDRIMTAGRRAEKITNAVLGLARNRSNEKIPTDLKSVFEESLILLEREMSKYRVAVVKQFEDVPKALACGNQIQQVLLNLLTNARQAMPQGGQVLLRLTHDEISNSVHLMIRDTGSGIPKEKLSKIFENFYTTKSGPDASGKGGTGVGLSMCRDIIESHQGKIRVQSEPGKGTAFTICLPVAAVKKNAKPPAAIQLGIPGNVPPTVRV